MVGIFPTPSSLTKETRWAGDAAFITGSLRNKGLPFPAGDKTVRASRLEGSARSLSDRLAHARMDKSLWTIWSKMVVKRCWATKGDFLSSCYLLKSRAINFSVVKP